MKKDKGTRERMPIPRQEENSSSPVLWMTEGGMERREVALRTEQDNLQRRGGLAALEAPFFITGAMTFSPSEE